MVLVGAGDPVEERENTFGIVFLQTVTLKVGDNLKSAQGSTVRAGGRHGIINIRDRNNACIRINIVRRKTAWIAGAVTALMMRECGELDVCIQRKRLLQFVTVLGVQPDLRELFVGVFARFVEKLCWNLELADVV